MNQSTARIARHVLLALLLGGAAWAGSDRLRLRYSPTADETSHVHAARELRSGPGVVSNFEHPILMKALAGLALPSRQGPDLWEEVRAARKPFPIVYGIFVAAASLWAMRRLGMAAGAAYGALLVIEPTLRGHAAVIHTDVLLMSLLGVTVVLLDLASRERRALPLTCLAGAAYGLALASKHSALLFLPVVALAGSYLIFWRSSSPRPRWRARRLALPLEAFVGCAVACFLAVQLAAASWTKREAFVSVAETSYGKFADQRVVNWIAERLPVGISSYAVGALQIRYSLVPGSRYHYFFGAASGNGWLLYFPVALALKLTTATVLLTALGLILLVVIAARSAPVRRRRRLVFGLVFLPLVIGGAYFAMAVPSRLSIGVRHVLPVVPLVLFAAVAAIRIGVPRRLRAAVLLAAVAGAAIEAGTHRGREISFGNLLAGGDTGLRRVLSDSNTDWGQAQETVYSRMARGDLGRCGILAIFFDMDRAAERGLYEVPFGDEKALDRVNSVFVSVFIVDILRGMEHNTDPYPHFVATRQNLVPWFHRIESRAETIEAVGDTYVLYRFRRRDGP